MGDMLKFIDHAVAWKARGIGKTGVKPEQGDSRSSSKTASFKRLDSEIDSSDEVLVAGVPISVDVESQPVPLGKSTTERTWANSKRNQGASREVKCGRKTVDESCF